MYSFTFEIDSNDRIKDSYHEKLEVEVEMWASEDDFSIESTKVYNESGDEINWQDLSEEDQSKIDKKAEKLAYEKAYEAYQEIAQMNADEIYEAWKDSLYE